MLGSNCIGQQLLAVLVFYRLSSLILGLFGKLLAKRGMCVLDLLNDTADVLLHVGCLIFNQPARLQQFLGFVKPQLQVFLHFCELLFRPDSWLLFIRVFLVGLLNCFHFFPEFVRQSQQLVRESLVCFFVFFFILKRLQWLDVVAQCDSLHAELRQQFQYLTHMLRVFSEVVRSEHLVKEVDVLDHLFP